MSKHLTMLLILAMSIQPLQAGGCDMAKNQGADQAADQLTQSHHYSPPANADSHPGADKMMDHGNMPDCCDTQNTDDEPACDHELGCGSCYLNTPLLSSLAKVISNLSIHHRLLITSGMIFPSHEYPLLRPPIA